jgi:hypothetical protein
MNVCSVMSCPSASLRSMSLRRTSIFLTVLMEQLYRVVVNTLLLPFVFPKYTCLPVLSPRWGPLPHLVGNFLARFMGHTFQFTLLRCSMMLCWNTSTYSLSTCVVFLRGHFPINPCLIPHRALSSLLSLGFDGFREFHNGSLFPAEAI